MAAHQSNWVELMDAEAFLESSRYAPTTKITYRRYLGYLQDWLAQEGLGLHAIDGRQFNRFLATRAWSPNTGRNCLEAVKAYFRLYRDPQHPLLGHKLRRQTPPPGRKVTLPQVELLLASCPDTRAGLQLMAIIRTLWDTWLRASEICAVRVDHLDLRGRNLDALTKGGYWETKRITLGTSAALEAWIRIRRRLARSDCRTLFCNTATGQPLTRDGLRGNFTRLARAAGFKVSPHDFRRGGPSFAAERGMPDRLGMLQGGWKDHAQYLHYTRGADLRAADRWLPGLYLDPEEKKAALDWQVEGGYGEDAS